MAIVIPSKHIYSKSFDPVIDNNIDKVETTVSNMSTQLKYDTPIYDKAHENIDIKTSYGIRETLWLRTSQTIPLPGFLRIDIFNAIKKTDLEILVPRFSDNGIIRKIYTGKIDGSDRIKCSIVCQKSIGQVNVRWLPLDNGTISILGYGEKFQTETNTQDISVKDYFLELVESKEYFSDEQKNQIVDDNLGTAKVTETQIDGISAYKLNFTNILCGFTRYYYVGNQYVIEQETGAFVSTCEYIEIVPQIVNISLNGDLLYLDIAETNIKIGNGKNMFSFDGNELIQTTNTPSVETKYQGIVDEWKNGKQTAAISCPVADYYDEEDMVQISPNGITKAVKIKYISKTTFPFGGFADFTFQEIETRFLKQNDKISVNGVSMTIDTYSETDGRFQCLADKTLSFSQEEIYNVDTKVLLSMTFQIGDIVIPYTYTNNGDKPMSYNKDFTPKQFKVVGTKISKRQGVMQELTLLED